MATLDQNAILGLVSQMKMMTGGSKDPSVVLPKIFQALGGGQGAEQITPIIDMMCASKKAEKEAEIKEAEIKVSEKQEISMSLLSPNAEKSLCNCLDAIANYVRSLPTGYYPYPVQGIYPQPVNGGNNGFSHHQEAVPQKTRPANLRGQYQPTPQEDSENG